MASDFDRLTSERELLRYQLGDFLENVALSEEIVLPTEFHVSLIKDFYFALNRAYKTWRIEDGHRTQPSKIAALIIVSVMAVSPFRCAVQSNEFFRVNPLFALHAGLSRVGVDVTGIGIDSVKRLIRWLNLLRLSGAAAWLEQARVTTEAGEFAGADTRAMSLTHHDIADIDMLIAYVEALSLQPSELALL